MIEKIMTLFDKLPETDRMSVKILVMPEAASPASTKFVSMIEKLSDEERTQVMDHIGMNKEEKKPEDKKPEDKPDADPMDPNEDKEKDKMPPMRDIGDFSL